MIKRPMSGKKRYSKKRYSNKRNTKKRNTKKRSRRYKKRYSKKNNLKGGLLTQEQPELLRKVSGRNNFCKKKNKFQKRTKRECDDKKPVCKWGIKEGETRERCMKDKVAILELKILELKIEGWIYEREQYEREQYEKDKSCHRGLLEEKCVYFNPRTNIDIVYGILRREAKSGSNVYLHLDSAHGRLYKMNLSRHTILNSNLHLILTPARGQNDRGLRVNNNKVKMLSIMKHFLDSAGVYLDDLFTRDGCMTLNGSLFFYSMALLHEMADVADVKDLILETIIKMTTEGTSDPDMPPPSPGPDPPDMPSPSPPPEPEPDLEEQEPEPVAPPPGIKLSLFLNAIKLHGGSIETIKNMLFRILKLYVPGDKVNDTLFVILREETDREKERKNGSKSGYSLAKWGLTILYTNRRDEKKYFHLPLNEIQPDDDGCVYLSQIIHYLEPLKDLVDHKFFLKHGSCRVDDEYDEYISSKKYTPPHPGSLTREISTPKEGAHKVCFINYFEDPQRRSEVRDYLRDFPTMVDYYLSLETKEKIFDFMDILMEHGEGSQELYDFIMNS